MSSPAAASAVALAPPPDISWLTPSIRAALAPGGPLAALAKHQRFILARFEWDTLKAPNKWNKEPINGGTLQPANAHDVANQMDAFAACTIAELYGTGYGPGFVLNAAEGFIVIDLDHCVVDGKLNDVATLIVSEFPGAYIETSTGGTGLHIICRGQLDPNHGCKNSLHGLECYSHGRYIQLTGWGAQGDPTTDCTAALAWLTTNYFPPKAHADVDPAIWHDTSVPADRDDALIARILSSRGSADAAFGTRATVQQLWNADPVALGRAFPADGRPYDASSADAALMQHLAFWTRKNAPQMWRIAHRSKLLRDKWSVTVHKDYLQRTIERAISLQVHVLEDRSSPAPVAAPAPGSSGRAPVSHHLCTDQRNAQRVFNAFNGRIMYAGGRWFYFDGTRWAADMGAVWECAQQLSALIRNEAIEFETLAKAQRAAGAPDGGFEADENAKALRAYGPKSETVTAKNNALTELQRGCAVEIDQLDTDNWALNCLNGTIDLRTGTLRPHNPADRITKVCPVAFNPAALAPIWQSFVLQIMAGDQTMVDFLRRWYGYCATGSTREQRFAQHIGKGANGKSTMLGAIMDVLGRDYSGEAAPGMLMSTKHENSRHPTEIADLRGKRLMTSSESAEDGALREDFIKRATGSDPLKARHMREDFFQFNPTHKLQQLTNHRPRIIGQDFAIWRRVMLIEYPIRFGTQAELSAGTVDALRDDTLSARLAKEREGIFAWIIAGTVEWLVSGLNPPAKVLAATKDYKAEQDTVGGFIVDECELGISNEAVFNAPAGSGIADSLYQRYTAWTEVNGIRPLSAKRFMGELQRLVPACRVSTTSRNSAVTPSKRHNVQIVHGIA